MAATALEIYKAQAGVLVPIVKALEKKWVRSARTA